MRARRVDLHTQLSVAMARGVATFGKGHEKKEVCTNCGGAGLKNNQVCDRCRGAGFYPYIPAVGGAH